MNSMDVLDLLERLKRAEATLLERADRASSMEERRLLSKRQGVALARSYVEEMLR